MVTKPVLFPVLSSSFVASFPPWLWWWCLWCDVWGTTRGDLLFHCVFNNQSMWFSTKIILALSMFMFRMRNCWIIGKSALFKCSVLFAEPHSASAEAYASSHFWSLNPKKLLLLRILFMWYNPGGFRKQLFNMLQHSLHAVLNKTLFQWDNTFHTSISLELTIVQKPVS